MELTVIYTFLDTVYLGGSRSTEDEWKSPTTRGTTNVCTSSVSFTFYLRKGYRWGPRTLRTSSCTPVTQTWVVGVTVSVTRQSFSLGTLPKSGWSPRVRSVFESPGFRVWFVFLYSWFLISTGPSFRPSTRRHTSGLPSTNVRTPSVTQDPVGPPTTTGVCDRTFIRGRKKVLHLPLRTLPCVVISVLTSLKSSFFLKILTIGVILPWSLSLQYVSFSAPYR